MIVERAAHEEDLPRVRWLLVLMTAIGFVAIAIRFVEFYMLIPRWDSNAYGSIVWLLLGLHATHLITDVGDSAVLTALMFTKHGRAKRFGRRQRQRVLLVFRRRRLAADLLSRLLVPDPVRCGARR